MKKYLYLLIISNFLFISCDVLVNPQQDRKGNHQAYQPLNIQTRTYFPFENNENWWSFTETTGNKLDIQVTDTISDDNVMYYRVSFREHQVDTTDDWFRRTGSKIQFGSSLNGVYDQFLPARLDSANGSFLCGNNVVRYSFRDSLILKGTVFHKVITLKYSNPIIHGFEEIIMAESLGIIQLKDYDGRWPVNYSIDSCMTSGVVSRFY